MSREPDRGESVDELLTRRLKELEEHAARFEEAMRDLERREELLRDMRASVERQLRLRSADLGAHDAELEETRRELGEREVQLREEEAELTRRRSELGAVELKREAVERRERALDARQAEIEAAAAETNETDAPGPATAQEARIELLFVPGATYRLVEIDPRPVSAGETLEFEDEAYVVAKAASSPLPDDRRRCAYLVRGVRTRTGSDGSS